VAVPFHFVFTFLFLVRIIPPISRLAEISFATYVLHWYFALTYHTEFSSNVYAWLRQFIFLPYKPDYAISIFIICLLFFTTGRDCLFWSGLTYRFGLTIIGRPFGIHLAVYNPQGIIFNQLCVGFRVASSDLLRIGCRGMLLTRCAYSLLYSILESLCFRSDVLCDYYFIHRKHLDSFWLLRNFVNLATFFRHTEWFSWCLFSRDFFCIPVPFFNRIFDLPFWHLQDTAFFTAFWTVLYKFPL